MGQQITTNEQSEPWPPPPTPSAQEPHADHHPPSRLSARAGAVALLFAGAGALIFLPLVGWAVLGNLFRFQRATPAIVHRIDVYMVWLTASVVLLLVGLLAGGVGWRCWTGRCGIAIAVLLLGFLVHEVALVIP